MIKCFYKGQNHQAVRRSVNQLDKLLENGQEAGKRTVVSRRKQNRRLSPSNPKESILTSLRLPFFYSAGEPRERITCLKTLENYAGRQQDG